MTAQSQMVSARRVVAALTGVVLSCFVSLPAVAAEDMSTIGYSEYRYVAEAELTQAAAHALSQWAAALEASEIRLPDGVTYVRFVQSEEDPHLRFRFGESEDPDMNDDYRPIGSVTRPWPKRSDGHYFNQVWIDPTAVPRGYVPDYSVTGPHQPDRVYLFGVVMHEVGHLFGSGRDDEWPIPGPGETCGEVMVTREAMTASITGRNIIATLLCSDLAWLREQYGEKCLGGVAPKRTSAGPECSNPGIVDVFADVAAGTLELTIDWSDDTRAVHFEVSRDGRRWVRHTTLDDPTLMVVFPPFSALGVRLDLPASRTGWG